MDEALWAWNNGFDTTWTLSGGITATKILTDPEFPAYPDPASKKFGYDNGASGRVLITVANYLTSTPQISTVGLMTLADGTVVKRGLGSTVGPTQLFTNALGALGNLTFSGGGIVDSYNSSLAYSPTVPTNLTSANSAAVLSGATVDVGKAQIYGFAATGGTALQNLLGASLIGPTTLTGTAIDSTRVSRQTVQPMLDVSIPSSYKVNSSVPLTSSQHFSVPGNYRYDSIMLDGSQELTIDAPVVLKVTNYVYIGSGSKIHVTTTGSLQLQIDSTCYSLVPDAALQSATKKTVNTTHLPQGLYLVGGGIVNDTAKPQNVSITVGSSIVPGTSPHSYSYIDTSQDFYGTVFLPNDAIDVPSNNFTLYGAMVAKNITFTGTSPQIHYDTALQRIAIGGFNTPWSLSQLHELTPSEISALYVP